MVATLGAVVEELTPKNWFFRFLMYVSCKRGIDERNVEERYWWNLMWNVHDAIDKNA